MTTIIGVQNEDSCVIVSDSRIVDNGKVYTHSKMVKAVERGNYIIGGAGDYRALQVVLHGWQPPLVTAKAKENLYEFAINKVMPSLKTTLIAAGVDLVKSQNDDDKILDFLNNCNVPKRTREPFPLPTLKHMKTEAFYKSLSEEQSLYGHLDPKDFQIENYQSHPSIKAPLSN
jgi:hypothetical protein